VGGFEALPFGVLVFVAGTLLVANAWAVLDAKIAASAAAREAARAFVESTAGSAEGATAEAQAAASEAMRGHGRDPGRMAVTTEGPLRFERCAPVTFVVAYPVASVVLPWIDGFGPGPVTVRARHREVVDPFRDDVPAGAAAGLAC
jgi:hypothetical protein